MEVVLILTAKKSFEVFKIKYKNKKLKQEQNGKVNWQTNWNGKTFKGKEIVVKNHQVQPSNRWTGLPNCM